MTFQCRTCRTQPWLTAGTLFQSNHLALTVWFRWFLAIYLISQDKTGLSWLALKRLLGVSYPTVWLIQHQAKTERERAHALSGDVQVDDVYLGGELTGSTPGRDFEN